MAKPKVVISVVAENEAGKTIEEVKSELDSLESEANRASDSMISKYKGVAAAIAGIGTAIGASIMTIKSSISTFKEFEFLRVRLENMYGSVEKGRKAFEAFNKIAATTPFELRDVVEAGATLKAFMGDVFNPQYLKIAADLAAYMGTNIVDAASAMGRAFAAGAGAADVLRERGILNIIKTRQQIDDFKNITLEEFREAMFRTLTDPKAGIVGATSKLAETIVGMESNMSDAFSRLKANIGERFAPAYKSFLRTVIVLTNDLNRALFKQSEAVQKQQLEFNAMIDVLKDTNVTEEVRKQIIEELNKKYPQYLKNINLEKASIEDLKKVQEEANKEFEKRIQMLAFQEVMEQETSRAVELIRQMKEIQIQLKKLSRTGDLPAAGKVAFERGLTVSDELRRRLKFLQEQYEQVKQRIKEIKEEYTNFVKETGVKPEETQTQQVNLTQPTEPVTMPVEADVQLFSIDEDAEKDLEETATELQNKLDEALIQEHLNNILSQQEAERTFTENYLTDRYQLELKNLDMIWEATSASFKQRLDAQKAYERERARIIQQAAAWEAYVSASYASQAIGAWAGALQAFEGIAGQHFALTKALMAAQALVDAYAAANRAMATIPPPWGEIVAAGIFAAGMANVASILAADMNTSMENYPTPNVDYNKVKVSKRQPETPIAEMATGGIIGAATGTLLNLPTVDIIPIMASRGEAIISREAVNRNRPIVEQLIMNRDVTTGAQNNITISPQFNISAVDAASVQDLVLSDRFRETLVNVINDGLLRLQIKDGQIISEVG